MGAFIRRYGFLIGLSSIFFLTLVDGTGGIAAAGNWLKRHQGPEVSVIIIFFLSGAMFEMGRARDGLKDGSGTLAALFIMFIVAPAVAATISALTAGMLAPGVLIGLLIVAVMPTTLSSGVVMTGTAGGNMAHALFITILANTLAVFTIPLSLSLLVQPASGTPFVIDSVHIMLTLGGYVILPLFAGITVHLAAARSSQRLSRYGQPANQLLVLLIVWMGISQTRQAILGSGFTMYQTAALSFLFHGILLVSAWILIRLLGLKRGRWESLLIMGCQKTLPLSIILQVSLFPQYPQALVFCVVHHVVHLMMDSYLVGRIRRG